MAPKSPKTRSATPGTRPEGSSEANRRARRKRAREAKEGEGEGGPSRVDEAGPSRLDDASTKPPANNDANGFGEDDFIAFVVSDKEDEDDEDSRERGSESFPLGKGKGKEPESLSAGRKRKADEAVDYDDGYANKKERLDAHSRRAPWAADVDWEKCNNVAEMLHREVDAFVAYMSPSPVEDEVRALVVALVSNAVTKTYPDAKVLPFGSYQTKLYLPLGDIDLVIASRSMEISNKAAVLQSLATTMKRAGITDKVTIIAKAKVPIIKFVTRHGRFSVDISINQTNGVKAGEMINRFLDELPALRGLVLITKAFLSQRKMNEVFSGGLGSYAIVCLAISFLQQHPKIRRGEIDPSRNLGVLMIDFFELYGHYFRYDEVGISVRDGGAYYKKAQRGWLDHRSPGLLSIEDPGDPSNDISRGSFAIARVRTSLAGAYSMLTATAYQRRDYIMARRERRYYPLQGRTDPESLSILSAVMGVTQETINHRRLVREVYDKRVLHRMVGVDPTASPVPTPSKPPSTRANGKGRRRESVAAAWEEADMDVESGEERGDVSTARTAQDDGEDESRYAIRRQPPKKRRRTGSETELHAMYTSDEDEDEGVRARDEDEGRLVVVHADLEPSASQSSEDSMAEEAAAYAVDTEGRASKAQAKRNYWLSKGVSLL